MAEKKKTPPKKTTDVEGQEPEGQEPTGDGDGDGDGDGNDGEEENRRINAIVTNRVKREMKGVLASLATMQKTLEGLAAPKPAAGDGDGDGDDEPAPKPTEDPKATKRFARLEKELAEQKARADKAERDRADGEERSKRNEMRNIYQAALTEHGVTDPRLMRAALDQLEQDGFMARDEEGKIRFKGLDKYGIETMFDPKAGLKGWIQQEGKSFVPAVDAGGSGATQARAPTGATRGEFAKLSPAQKAAIEIDRASQGLPPLE